MKFAIFGNSFYNQTIQHLDELIVFLIQKESSILLESELYDIVQQKDTSYISKVKRIENQNFEADYALSLGGDGTFLKTAALVGDKTIPILGINFGHLGYLSEVSSENMFQIIEALLQGSLVTENRSVLHVHCIGSDQIEQPFALNEVTVSKQETASMISIHASLNGEPIHTYQADGLIISTPTGSTAYSMSVGGPIVVPQANNFILSPVATHSLNVRPLIVPDTWIIDLEVKSRSDCFQLVLDGRTTKLPTEVKIQITKAKFSIVVLKQADHTFFDNLKKKLLWGVDKRII